MCPPHRDPSFSQKRDLSLPHLVLENMVAMGGMVLMGELP